MLVAGHDIDTNNNRVWIAHRLKKSTSGAEWTWEWVHIDPSIDMTEQIKEYMEFYDLQHGAGMLEWFTDGKPPLEHVEKMIEAADIILTNAQSEYDSLLQARENLVNIIKGGGGQCDSGDCGECEFCVDNRCLHNLH